MQWAGADIPKIYAISSNRKYLYLDRYVWSTIIVLHLYPILPISCYTGPQLQDEFPARETL